MNEQLIKQSYHTQPHPTQSIPAEKAFFMLSRIVKPGSLVVVISDFHFLSDSIMRDLTPLAEHNELIAFRVYDPLEEKLPHNKLTYTDGNHNITLTPDDKPILSRFSDRAKHFKNILEKNLSEKNIPLFHFSTQDEVFLSLNRIFHKAARRPIRRG